MTGLTGLVARGLASCFFLSYLPAAFIRGPRGLTGAGLIGTLAGLLSLSALPAGGMAVAWVLIGATALAVAISDRAEREMGRTDDPRIVIDEWVGYWFAIALLPRTLPCLFASFVLFRLFDVFKTPWQRTVSQYPGGWGVVLDDVLAGIFANLILEAFIRLPGISASLTAR
jgi:phosphatidylglycerophosphatase A